jgi:NAD(P)-dependent dehydrogenase (short-subunit alcohol dehydrogenase family)
MRNESLVAVVTGANRGIGLEVAYQVARSFTRRSLGSRYSWYDHSANMATEVFEIVQCLVDGTGI